nr:MAG TPA: hypothetical protein [Caudoviricetes sp.]
MKFQILFPTVKSQLSLPWEISFKKNRNYSIPIQCLRLTILVNESFITRC